MACREMVVDATGVVGVGLLNHLVRTLSKGKAKAKNSDRS